jgi:DNA-binding MarR family transcriptional regulator
MSEVDDELAATWQALVPLFLTKRDEFFETLQRHGLTPPHMVALGTLRAGPRRMGDMAGAMACDASWVTAVVDHLEAGGLVQRRPAAGDRRAKEVELTPKGRRFLAEVETTMSAPPAAFAALSATDQRQLRRILAKIVAPSEPVGWIPTRFIGGR